MDFFFLNINRPVAEVVSPSLRFPLSWRWLLFSLAQSGLLEFTLYIIPIALMTITNNGTSFSAVGCVSILDAQACWQSTHPHATEII